MKKYLKYLVMLISLPLFAQNPQQISNVGSIQWVANTPKGPASVSASVVGNQGPGTLYYWVIAKFVSGNSSASFVTAYSTPNVLTADNYVKISWQAVNGATGYDVIRSFSPGMPSSGNIGVVLNTQNLYANDTGTTLVAYTVTNIASSTCDWTINNTSSLNVNVIPPCLNMGGVSFLAC